jgi:thiamine biosynthesis lipoprotein
MRTTKEASVRRARPLLGTFVEIAAADAGHADMHAAIEAAFDAVAQVHELMSFHDVKSDVGRLNREAGSRTLEVHRWTFDVLETAIDLNRRSAGVFDITVAPILQDLGLLPGDASQVPRRRAGGQPDREESASTETIVLLPGGRVRLAHPGIRIDLGGIAKGFAVDRALDVLRDRGMPRGWVNAGGDLAAFGSHFEQVHIRDPRDPSRLMLQIKVENQALASSGQRFDPVRSAAPEGSAVIDPRTSEPVQTIIAATVLAPSCMMADALTKVVMVAGPSATALLEHCRAAALLVSASGDVRMTPDFQGAISLAN